MKIYHIKLRVKTGLLTPFQADTIFGHICWVIAHGDGDGALQNFLQPFKDGNPPFVLSDGFPENYLPKPISVDFVVSEDRRKDIKKIDYLHPDDFNLLIQGKTHEEFKPLPLPDEVLQSVTSTHNTINRLTNTTSEESGVYSLPETVIPKVSIYLKSVDAGWKDKVVSLLKDLSQVGYGRKKSIGKGQFTVAELVEEYNFPEIKDANGFVTLSNFCPAKDDPTEGLYKTFVKYGKLGEEFTFCGNPFKRPLLMIKAGSVFKTTSPPKAYYGRMLSNIAPAKEDSVVHYAYAFAMPVKFPEINKQ
jgi:CRISPR-associated protein Csm4